ncbi:MAG: helix-turn-helix domain-containing protein [Eubacteriales bacterium]|nr:helix-turn-helix domain-containing protein [Eubacteriales bacterium]
MKEINIAKVLVTKRKEKGITQDELANYIGVSKASVSKWETGQSYPDITLLPPLAAYFNISIDDLMGYQPQMEKGAIRRLYFRLARDFAEKPSDTVFLECREIIRKYYACFPLLLKMAALFINHHMLITGAEERAALLSEAATLCERVRTESGDVALGKEAVSLEAACRMLRSDPQGVLDLLGEQVGLFSTDGALIGQAYQMLGNAEKAKETAQIGLYQHLVMLVGETATYLTLCAEDKPRAAEIIRRTLIVCDAFQLEALHSNTMAQFYLAAAYADCRQGLVEDALAMLGRYTALCRRFSFTLHGDAYFDALDAWFSRFDLGAEAPRSEKLIRESMLAAVAQNPSFQSLADDPRFQMLVAQLRAGASPAQ